MTAFRPGISEEEPAAKMEESVYFRSPWFVCQYTTVLLDSGIELL